MATQTFDTKNAKTNSYVADAQGRFGGEFGGRFVPETIIPALDELTAEYEKAKADPAFQAAVRLLRQELCRPPHAAVLRRKDDARTRRRADLSQARRPGPHGRAQDQQRARADSARQAHEQAAHHRRDRRGPARRRHGDRLRPVRLPVRRLHGRGRRAAAGAQCRAHEAARRGSPPRHVRHADAERRAQRGHARLGDECPRHALHHRHGRRAAPLPDHGPRLPDRSSASKRGSSCRKTPAACPMSSSPASAAAPTRWASSTRSSTTRACG